MQAEISIDTWELNEPFITSKDRMNYIETLTLEISEGKLKGRGEAIGVDYLGETANSMADRIMEAIAEARGEKDRSLQTVVNLLPPGGARNAVDCARWDLESKRCGKRAWELLQTPSQPVLTCYTLALDDADAMARQAIAHPHMPVLKLKLDHESPAEKVMAVHQARPDAELLIDANGGWTPEIMNKVADVLAASAVSMLEQPLEMGEDAGLENLAYPVPLCADESCQSLKDLDKVARRYDLVNIKLDKCGGLSEALQMVQWCRANEMPIMVGNMLGSSLAMSPAFLVAQYCRFVDLDGPLWQRTDRQIPIIYDHAIMQSPDADLWG